MSNSLEKTIEDLSVKVYDINQFKNFTKKIKNDVALKVFKHNDVESIKALEKEIKLHIKVDMNDRIIRFYGVTIRPVSMFELGHKYVLVLELANNGTLRDYLQKNKSLNWHNRLRLPQELSKKHIEPDHMPEIYPDKRLDLDEPGYSKDYSINDYEKIKTIMPFDGGIKIHQQMNLLKK
ncbi:25542_t:CDS:2 [Dentiscutata erythropus]|uniref:25542_t:CDS:1 n=1 Tax=Dentiscutata erythropus TaxID=1348616 RepID=A0A9N9GI78_9GLOM|nr:25542_t:CDS:2 [Dentiscutata erythropus]